jgi:hypothetical protein
MKKIILIGIFMMLCTTVFSFTSSATAYNPSLTYYKCVSITNPSAGYQMKINISYSTGGNVSCNSHCQTDFDDIRFVAQDNVTLLDYWLERKTDSSFAWFWVETNGDSILNIYYGNNQLTSSSSGTNTFYLFDDFNDGSIDANKWSTLGSPTETGGFIEITGTNTEEIYSKTSYGSGYAIHSYGELYTNQGSGEPTIGFNNDIQDANCVEIYTYSTGNALSGYTKKASASANNVDLTETETTIYKLWDIMFGSTSFCGFQCNMGTVMSVTNSANIPTGSYPINLFVRYSQDICKMDYVCVRKYTQTQPCWNIFGSEVSTAIPVKPCPPVLTGAYGINIVNLSWTYSGTGTDKVAIFRNSSSFPTLLTGLLIYNGTDLYFSDTTVNIGQVWYYSAYAFNNTTGLSNCYSTTYGVIPNYPWQFYYTDINAIHTFNHYGSYNDTIEGWVDAYNFTSTGITTPYDETFLDYNFSGSATISLNATGYHLVWSGIYPELQVTGKNYSISQTNPPYYFRNIMGKWYCQVTIDGNNTPLYIFNNSKNVTGGVYNKSNATGKYVYVNLTGSTSSINYSSLNETDSDWLYLGAMLSIDDSQFYLLILISLWAFFIFLYEEKQKNIYALCLVFLGLPLGIIISGIAYYNSYPFGYLISFIIILISFLIPAYNQFKSKKK